MKQIDVEIELETPAKMHKFNGLERENELKTKPIQVQLEAHAYRVENGNLAFPATWFYHALLDRYKIEAGKKWKEKRLEVAPRIRVCPELIDLGVKEFEVDRSSVPAPGGKMREEVYKPRVPKGTRAKFTIQTTIDPNELREKLEATGSEVGIGNDRYHGYGRFRVIGWKIVSK